MSTSVHVSELLLRWEELKEQGQMVSLEDLCVDAPELLPELRRQVAALSSLNDLMKSRNRLAGSTVADATGTDHNSVTLTPPGYEILGELGRGGMGVVYRARDVALNRDVAIKLLRHSEHDDDQSTRRFLEEARITGQLQHPGIPPIHEIGTLPEGRPFLVMKLIKGRTFSDLLEQRRDSDPDLARLLSVFEQICLAVGYAHSRGVVHRDLKPANVMVGAFGEVQVMDWGLAKVMSPTAAADSPTTTDVRPGTVIRSLRERGTDTQAGSVLGTPAFMPPEQAGGEVDRIDPRTDVFGLGAILCVIFTGQPPYTGKDVHEIHLKAVRGQTGDAIERLDGCGAEPDLVALCKKCLSLDPGHRPADGAEVAGVIASFRRDAERRARQAELDRVRAEGELRTAELKAVEQRKRQWMRLALATSVAVLVFGVGVSGWWWDRQRENAKLKQAEFDAESARLETARARVEAEAEVRQARHRDVALGLLGQVEGALRAGDAERATELLDQAGKRIAEGGADELTDRFSRCQFELAMLQKLDRIANDQWIVVDGKRPPAATLFARWAEAFAGYGIAPGTTSPAEAARRIDGSFIREQLLTSLETWFVHRRHDVALRAILAFADPDEFRNEARTTSYAQALLTRAFHGKRLPAAQPVWFAVAHGQDDLLAQDSREQLLLGAHQTRPSSFPLLMALANLGGFGDKELASERAGWCRAALALQPRNSIAWLKLAVALHDLGERSTAVAAFREAIKLDPNFAPTHNVLGVHLRVTGDLPGAIAACQEAIRLDPREPSAHAHLGNALMDSGDVPGAIAAYNDALRLDPTLAPAHANLGAVLTRAGDLTGAIASCKQAIHLDPKYAPAHTNLGVALHESGDLRGAMTAHAEAIRLNPRYALAHNNMGSALHESGDLPGAIAAFKEAIRLDPKDSSAHSNLGGALVKLGQGAAAILACEEALRLDPRSARAHDNMGSALYLSGNLPGAIAEFKEAIRLKPEHDQAYYNLGIALKDSGDLPGAIAAYREAIRLKPRQARFNYNLGLALYASGDRPGAMTALKEAIRLDPGHAAAHTNLGIVLHDSGDRPGAIVSFKAAIRLDPKFALAHYNLGVTLLASGDLPGAIASFKEAIRLDPKYTMAHYNLGIAMSLSGDPPGAIASFNEAIRLDLGFAKAHYNLGLTLRKQGDLPGAIAAYREAIRRDPGYVMAYNNLGAIYLNQQRSADAIACAHEAIKLAPKFSNAHALLGMALQQSGDVSGARRAIAEANRLDPRQWGPLLAKLPPIPVAPPPREVP